MIDGKLFLHSAKTSNNRKEFARMLEEIMSPKYNAILTWSTDRLARTMRDAGELIDMLDKNAIVDLKFPTFTFEKNTSGLMALGMQFIFAKQYSDQLSVSSGRGRKNAMREGKSVGNTKYGYKISPFHYYVPDGENFKIFQKALKMVLEKQSLAQIATYLNNQGFTNKGKEIRSTIRAKFILEYIYDILDNCLEVNEDLYSSYLESMQAEIKDRKDSI